MEPAKSAIAEPRSFPEAQPFVELRQRARRREDSLKTVRGVVLGVAIGTAIWATAFAVAAAVGML